MKHFNLERHQIYIAVIDKYNNTILPEIVNLLIPYLLNNRDKLDLYLSRKVKLSKLLRFLKKKAKENDDTKLLDQIIEFVEGECSNTSKN